MLLATRDDMPDVIMTVDIRLKLNVPMWFVNIRNYYLPFCFNENFARF